MYVHVFIDVDIYPYMILLLNLLVILYNEHDIYIYMCIYVYTCIYVCMYVYTCVFVYTYIKVLPPVDSSQSSSESLSCHYNHHQYHRYY